MSFNQGVVEALTEERKQTILLKQITEQNSMILVALSLLVEKFYSKEDSEVLITESSDINSVAHKKLKELDEV